MVCQGFALGMLWRDYRGSSGLLTAALMLFHVSTSDTTGVTWEVSSVTVGFWGQCSREWEPRWVFDPAGKVERSEEYSVDPVGCAACGGSRVLVSMTVGSSLKLNSSLEEAGSI